MSVRGGPLAIAFVCLLPARAPAAPDGPEACLPRRVAATFVRRERRIAAMTEAARQSLETQALVRAAHALARAERTLRVLRSRLGALATRTVVPATCSASVGGVLDGFATRIAAVRTGATPPSTTTSTTLATPSSTLTPSTTTSTTLPDSHCGNGVLDRFEQCDGTNLFGRTCVTLGFPGGELRCGPDCIFDVSHCATY